MNQLAGIERPNVNDWTHKIKHVYIDPPFGIAPKKVFVCESCRRPCGIIHDLLISGCCRSKVEVKEC